MLLLVNCSKTKRDLSALRLPLVSGKSTKYEQMDYFIHSGKYLDIVCYIYIFFYSLITIIVNFKNRCFGHLWSAFLGSTNHNSNIDLA